MIKKILLAILVIAIIGVCTGVYLWNKKPPKAEDSKGIAVTATGITKEYTDNEKKADSMYLDKVLEVSGTITEVNKNQDSAVVVVMDSGDPMAAVQCTMRERNVSVAKGQQVVIKGFCRGNNMGLVLTDCILK